MRASGVPRNEIFLTTKVPTNTRTNDFARSVDESLRNLGVDFVDLLMVHWPNRKFCSSNPSPRSPRRSDRALHAISALPISTLRCSMKQSGSLRSRWPHCKPSVHAYLDQTKLSKRAGVRGLIFTAYCPLAADAAARSGPRRHCPRKGRSVAQIALRWLPTAGEHHRDSALLERKRMADNMNVFSTCAHDDEMKRIGALSDGWPHRQSIGRAPAWD